MSRKIWTSAYFSSICPGGVQREFPMQCSKVSDSVKVLIDTLGYMQEHASARKMRLFVCACCRLTWRELKSGNHRRAVRAAERYADGLIGRKELRLARQL